MRQLQTVAVVVALVVMFSVAAEAAGNLQIGFKGGLGLSSIYGETYEYYYWDDWDDYYYEESYEYSGKLGLAGGGFITIYFADYFGVQAELLFVRKGAVMKLEAYYEDYYDIYYIEEDINVNLDYIEVPILAKIRLPLGESFAPNFFAGGSLCINTGAQWELDGETIDLDCITPVDLGIITGFGFDVVAEPICITADVRYEIGLLNINDENCLEDEIGSCYDIDVLVERNHALIAMIGIGFTL